MKHSDVRVYICQDEHALTSQDILNNHWTWSQEAKVLLTVPMINSAPETLGFTCEWAFIKCFTPFKELNYVWQDTEIKPSSYAQVLFAKTIRVFCILYLQEFRGSHIVKSHHAFHVASSSLLKLPHHGLQSGHATLQETKDSCL